MIKTLIKANELLDTLRNISKMLNQDVPVGTIILAYKCDLLVQVEKKVNEAIKKATE